MRILAATAFGLAVLTCALAMPGGSAFAQGRMPKYEPTPEQKPLYDERKFKAATDSVPDAAKSNDPWAGARDVTPAGGTAPAAKPKHKAKVQ
jgi:hypothetical protein